MTPYATHLPVLRAIGKVLQVWQVVEFGGGHYSTLEFLNKQTFPDLKWLWTVEANPAWKEVLEPLLEDARFQLVDFPIGCARMRIFASLVFVDDGQNLEERAWTLRTISAEYNGGGRHDSPPIVIHDYEQPAYHEVLEFEHEWIFDALLPNTGIVWNGDAISKSQIEEIERLSKESLEP